MAQNTLEKLFTRLDTHRLNVIGDAAMNLRAGTFRDQREEPRTRLASGSVQDDTREGTRTVTVRQERNDRRITTIIHVTPGEFDYSTPEIRALQCTYRDGKEVETAQYPPMEGEAELCLQAISTALQAAKRTQNQRLLIGI